MTIWSCVTQKYDIYIEKKWKAENSGPSIWRKASLGMPPPVGQKIPAVEYNKEIMPTSVSNNGFITYYGWKKQIC